MAKIRNKVKTHKKTRDILRSTNASLVKSPMKQRKEKPISDLLTEATTLLEQSQPDLALPIVEEALRRLEAERLEENKLKSEENEIPVAPVAVLAGETQLSLGNAEAACTHFLRATVLDPDGLIVSADPWLWLAQLSEIGGKESISYFTCATDILRREIGVLNDSLAKDNGLQHVLEEKQVKLADVLCSMTEVYMTDLSWEADAEQKCENLVTEAMTVVPGERSAGTLQCLASVRISQERVSEAKLALRKSLEVWANDEESMPDFAGRVSLARLLMEVEMLREALVVIDGLVKEDDQSVEAWYLGGWCRILHSSTSNQDEDEKNKTAEEARHWLKTCLRLCHLLEYEDEKLKAHAAELVQELVKVLGPDEGENDEEEADEEWQDEESEDGIEVLDDADTVQAAKGDVDMS